MRMIDDLAKALAEKERELAEVRKQVRMSKINDGGTAFPTEYNDRGLSVRDYFAGQYLVGKVNADELARDAYMVADAMLEARMATVKGGDA